MPDDHWFRQLIIEAWPMIVLGCLFVAVLLVACLAMFIDHRYGGC